MKVNGGKVMKKKNSILMKRSISTMILTGKDGSGMKPWENTFLGTKHQPLHQLPVQEGHLEQVLASHQSLQHLRQFHQAPLFLRQELNRSAGFVQCVRKEEPVPRNHESHLRQLQPPVHPSQQPRHLIHLVMRMQGCCSSFLPS